MPAAAPTASAVAEMAFLSGAAYESGNALSTILANNGWALVKEFDPLIGSNAAGFLARKGATLAIVFRGSDLLSPADLVEATAGQALHYFELGPLVDAALNYVNTDGAGVTSVFVTGHSLGGAMAEWFAQYDASSIGADRAISIATFGSPGTPNSDPTNTYVQSVLNVGTTEDYIYQHSGLYLAGLGSLGTQGRDIVADLPNATLNPIWGEHDLILYDRSARALAASPFAEDYLSASNGRALIVDALRSAGEAQELNFANRADALLVLGDSGLQGFADNDTLVGGSNNDWIDGGVGDDELDGSGGNDRLYGGLGRDDLRGGAGNDMLDGAGDFDVAVFGGNRADYLVELTGAQVRVTDLRPGSPDGIDTLTNIEQLEFADEAVSLPQGGQQTTDPLFLAEARFTQTVAALPSGGFVLVWVGHYFDEPARGVFAQLLGPDGTRIGDPIVVQGPVEDSFLFPDIGVLADGGFVVTWLSGVDENAETYVRRFDASGTPQGPVAAVNPVNPGSPNLFGDAAGLTGGGYVVAWSVEGAAGGMKFQRFDASGGMAGPEVVVDAPELGSSVPTGMPSVLPTSDGGFFIAWTTSEAAPTGPAFALHMQKFDATGQSVWDEIDATPSASWRAASIAFLEDGTFVVVGGAGDAAGLYAQRFEAGGAPIGDPIFVTSDAVDTIVTATPNIRSGLGGPAVAATSDGGFLVTWATSFSDGALGVFAQRFDAAGHAVGGTAFLGDGGIPSVAASAGGGYFVTWLDGIDTEILGAFFGDVPGGENVAPSVDDSSRSGSEDASIAGTLTAVDPDSATITFTVVTGPSHGTLTLGPGGAFSYQPNVNYHGPDSFTFKANDGAADSNIATVNLTITPVNDAPTVAGGIGNQSGVAGTALSIGIPVAAFADVDGDVLTYTATLANGSNLPAWLTLSGSTFTGTPTAAADLLSIKVTARDPAGLTASTTFDLVIAKSVTEGSGNDSQLGGAGADTLSGGDGADTIAGGDNADTLSGGNGNDNLKGDAGQDSLDGGVNNDTLAGGGGNDLLIGGRGNDVLRGDEGADMFLFSRGPGRDVVSDFVVGTDHLRLADGLAVKSWSQVGADTVIVFNEPAAQVTLVGVTGLTAATFGSLFDG